MILLGDLHLGIKKFNREIAQKQIEYIKTVIDKASELDKIIFQFGDLCDNRTTSDIFFLDQVKDMFEYLKKKDVVMYTLVGNHDIYLRESRDTTLIQHFQELYPKNFIIFNEKEVFEYHNKNIYIVPWLVKGESLSASELKNKDAVFGHFEISGFEVVKGHRDEKSSLSESFFKKAKCPCFSGHYHIKNIKPFVKYLGTPYQLNWNDFNEIKGYYIMDENLDIEFIENTISPVHLKIYYNEDQKKPLEIKGTGKIIKCDFEEFKSYLSLLKDSVIKFIIEKSQNSKHEEFLFLLQENNIDCEVINNHKINELIELDIDSEKEIKPSRELILDFIKENNPELIDLTIELLREVDTEMR